MISCDIMRAILTNGQTKKSMQRSRMVVNSGSCLRAGRCILQSIACIRRVRVRAVLTFVVFFLVTLNVMLLIAFTHTRVPNTIVAPYALGSTHKFNTSTRGRVDHDDRHRHSNDDIMRHEHVHNDYGMSRKSMVVTGMIKDGEARLLPLLTMVEQFVCHFGEFEIVIMENNSKDKTWQLLQIWQQRPIHCDPRLKAGNATSTRKHVLHFDKAHDPVPDAAHLTREDRYVYYRNIQLEYIKNLTTRTDPHSRAHYDYVMVLDFDVQSIDQSAIFTEFMFASQVLNADAFCVMGMEYSSRYRDSFASIFEDGSWCFDDFSACHQRLQKQRFTKMTSCFGGLAIYRWRDVAKCRYYTFSELARFANATYEWSKQHEHNWMIKQHRMCEHIAFHECLHKTRPRHNFSLLHSRDSYLYYGQSSYDPQAYRREQQLYSESHF